MPTITTLKDLRKPKPKEEKQERNQTEMRILRQKAYQNKKWRKLRETYMHQHPLCEECLKVGKVTAAVDVHHVKSPFHNPEGQINWDLLLDENNLKSLCKDCHGKLHSGRERSPQEIIDALDELMKDVED